MLHRNPKGREKGIGKFIFELTVTENFPNLMKNVNIHSQETKNKINRKFQPV